MSALRPGRMMLRRGRGGGRFVAKGWRCGERAILPLTRHGTGAKRAARPARAPGRLCRRQPAGPSGIATGHKLYRGATALGSPAGGIRPQWSHSRSDPPAGHKAAVLAAQQYRWGEVARRLLQPAAGTYCPQRNRAATGDNGVGWNGVDGVDTLGVLGARRGGGVVRPRLAHTTAAASSGRCRTVVGGSRELLNITSGYVTAWNVRWACGPVVRQALCGSYIIARYVTSRRGALRVPRGTWPDE